MNDALQQQLADLLAKLSAVAQDSAAWAAQQIPPLVQEKIAFGRAWETSAFVIIVLALAPLGYWTWRGWRRAYRDDFDFDTTFPMSLASIPFLGLSLGALVQLHDVMLVWFAPRLYIVEWLMDLVPHK